MWIEDAALEQWQSCGKGGQARYSEAAIRTSLIVRTAFKLPLRQTEGLMASVIALMGLAISVPDHTAVSRRAVTLPVAHAKRVPQGPLQVLIGSAGLQVYGAGQWLEAKHGAKSRRTWRKLHLAVDAASCMIVAQTLIDQHVDDPSQVVSLPDQIEGEIAKVMADGAYDGAPTHETIAAHGDDIEVVIPPRSTAAPSGATGPPTQRDLHVAMVTEHGRLGWQAATGYGTLFRRSRRRGGSAALNATCGFAKGNSMTGVYEGLTVIELADRRNQWAGKLLSDGGARVIQVEPIAGSPGRWCGPFADDKPDPDLCIDYWWNNTGKQSAAVDVARPAGRDLLKQLLAKADVFLESTPPGTLANLGLGYDAAASNRNLIYASLTDFGQDGPWRDYVANDVAHLALGGQMASSGYSDPKETPIGGKGHHAWHMGCAFMLHGITAALIERMGSGEGQFIDVSIHDACAIGTEAAVPQWMYYGSTMYRQTGMHANPKRQPPLQLPTADGKYMIAVMQNFGRPVWEKLIKWMDEKGVTGELHDPKYQDEAFRMSEYRTGNVIRDAIARLIAASDGEECFHRAQSYNISWGLVHAAEENYDVAHYRQRDYWRSIEHPQIGRAIPYPRGPFACDALRIEPRGRAPNLGEHTQHVLAHDLGMSADAIMALRTSGVVR